MSQLPHKTILAFIGMPGAGKSEATAYLKQEGYPVIRFGDLTEEAIKEAGLVVTTDNERLYREKIRAELGMGAYAIKAYPKIIESLKTHNIVLLDGLYSWEEYKFLIDKFPDMKLVCIYAEPEIRYQRLAVRPLRPVPLEKSRQRDFAEIERLNKGGPIAITDHLIENNGDEMEALYEKLDKLLKKIL
jgi:dephospho-CoA kinase